MALEKFANNATGILNGAINNSVTSLDVVDASPFPSSGNFRIIIDSEIMLVTAVSSNTFTVTRGIEGTSAASHSNSADVKHVLTAAAMDAFRSDNIASGTYASLPSAAKAGRIYLPTDSFYDQLYDNGSSWDHFFRGRKVTPPTGFSWMNQGSATIVTTNGGEYLETLNETDNNHLRYISYPSPTFEKTLCCIPNIPVGTQGYPNVGLAISDGTKIITMGIGWRADSSASSPNNYRGSYMEVIRWSGVSTFNAESFVYNTSYFGPIWMKFRDDNTSRYFKVSYDGTNFITVFSESRTNYFTPTRLGYYVNSANASLYTGITILGWD